MVRRYASRRTHLAGLTPARPIFTESATAMMSAVEVSVGDPKVKTPLAKGFGHRFGYCD
jgi:hypothetical protein